MKKLYSTIMLLAMMVAALSLTACGGDDRTSGSSSNLELKNLIGTWTTVAVNSVPPSREEDNFMDKSFQVYLDDGYRYHNYYGGLEGRLTLENSVICVDAIPIMDVLSFDGTSLTVKNKHDDGAVLVMKKLGTLTNDDYKNKLVHGIWLHSFHSSESDILTYYVMSSNEKIQNVANSHDNECQFFQFAKDGTGIYYSGHSGYSYEWELSEKKLTIRTSKGANMASKVAFVGIEGRAFLKFEKTFYWGGF